MSTRHHAVRPTAAVLPSLFPRTALVGALLSTWAAAQCQIGSQVEIGVGGIDNQALASVMWDPDGPGPAGQQLVLGGKFRIAGDIDANHVVLYEPATEQWSPLGSGLDGFVNALAVSPSGELYAGGSFQTAGGATVRGLARWDGAVWQPVGILTGLAGFYVNALTFLPNGDLIVAGNGLPSGTLPGRLARWDGTAWSWLGGDANDNVFALRTLPNGDLVAGGWFTSIGGTAAASVARWNGSAWSPLGAGFNGPVYTLSTTSTGTLFAGGSFSTSGGPAGACVARWNGTAWQSLGSGCNATVYGSMVAANGDLVVVGNFSTAGGQSAKGIARWNGTAWSDMGTGSWAVLQFGTSVIELPNGDVVVCKNMGPDWNGGPGQRLMRWTGNAWRAMGNGIDGQAVQVLTMPNGDDLVLGYFTRIGGVAAPYCARRGSGGWSALGSGLDRAAECALLDASGDLVVGGRFTTAGGVTAAGLARWDGAAWLPMLTTLSGANPAVMALAWLPNGDLLIAGQFTAVNGVAANNIARWDGSAWHALGSGVQGSPAFVRCLLVLPNGEVIVGGNFTNAGGVTVASVARWNGSAWSSLGSFATSSNLVASLELLANGDILATGSFFVPPSNSRNLARWNGTAWQPFAGGFTSQQWHAIVLPDGDLLATHKQSFGNTRLHRFAGGSWTPLTAMPDTELRDAKWNADGSMLAAVVRERGSGYAFSLLRLATTCPAAVTPLGTGCAGSAGPVTLAAESLPWTGATFRTVASGFPANSIGLLAAGVSTTNVPLVTLLPQGLPGCALFVQPIVLQTMLPNGSTATSALSLPDSMAFAGFVMHQQMVVVEIGGSGLSAFTSSNGLSLTVGTF
ncbi:MAG: hypothetical protein MUC36_26310 [Planctomycetes bacterium]|nr:hypothetical protein [Planctomycetota bacterium]